MTTMYQITDEERDKWFRSSLTDMTMREKADRAIYFLERAENDTEKGGTREDAPIDILLARPKILMALRLDDPAPWVVNMCHYLVYPLFWELRKRWEL